MYVSKYVSKYQSVYQCTGYVDMGHAGRVHGLVTKNVSSVSETGSILLFFYGLKNKKNNK